MHQRNYLYYKDGTVIFEEGTTGKEIYFIINGQVEVSQLVDGEKKVMAVLEKGDFFGEMASLNNDVRSMTVKAIGDTYLEELSLDEMLEYMQSDAEFLRDVCSSLAKRLRDADLKVKDLTLRAWPDNEDDYRMEKISYLRKRIKDKERQVEGLRNQIQSLKRRSSFWRRLFRRI